MHRFSRFFCMAILFFIDFQNIITNRCSERCNGRICTGIRRSNEPDNKNDTKSNSQLTTQGHHGKHTIVAHRCIHGVVGHFQIGILTQISKEICTQKEKNQVYHNKDQRKRNHIFFGVVDVATGQIFLHHILVQTCHSNGNKHASKEMFPPIIFHIGVI